MPVAADRVLAINATVQPARHKVITVLQVIVYADGRQGQWHQMHVSAAAMVAALAAAQLRGVFLMAQPARHKVNIVLREAAYPDGRGVQLVLPHPARPALQHLHQPVVQLALAILDAVHAVL